MSCVYDDIGNDVKSMECQSTMAELRVLWNGWCKMF